MKDAGRGFFYKEIEALRGVAALAVLGLHCYWFWPSFRMTDATTPALRQAQIWAMGAGASSVTLFFVISGLVLRLSLDAKSSLSLRGFIEFGLARIFRIYPLVLAVIGIWVLTSAWLPYGGDGGYGWINVTRNMLLVDATIDWPTWSTRVEIAAAPLIFAAWSMRRWSRSVALLVVAAIALGAAAFALRQYSDDLIWRYLASFLFGMLIVDIPATLARRIPTLFTLVFLAVFGTLCVCARPFLSYHSQWAIVIETLGWSAFLYFLVMGNSGPIRTALLTAPLRAIGKISFSVFLLHFFVLWILLRHLPSEWMGTLSGGDPMIESTIVLVIVIGLTLPLCGVTYFLIEAPGIALGRRVRSRLAAARTTGAAQSSQILPTTTP